MSLEEKALELLKNCNDAVLTTMGENGYPRSCMLGVIGFDDYKTIYFSTGYGTKARHLKSNSKASVCYVVGPDSVTLSGDAEIIDDIDEKKRVWHDWMINIFPKGAEDENYCLIKFTGKEATFWINQVFERDKQI